MSAPTPMPMEERGVNTDRGDQNREIKNSNDNLDLLEKELAESENRLAGLKQPLAAERMEQIQKTVRARRRPSGKGRTAPAQPPKPEPRSRTGTASASQTARIPRTVEPPRPPPAQPKRPKIAANPIPLRRIIDRQNYAERAEKEEEQKQDTDREREKEEQERERKPDRER